MPTRPCPVCTEDIGSTTTGICDDCFAAMTTVGTKRKLPQWCDLCKEPSTSSICVDCETVISEEQLQDCTEYTSLDDVQRRAVRAILSGKSVFLTGGPGAGKTHTLLVATSLLTKRGPGSVLMTASTGVAALLINGQTVHSFPGPGVPKFTTEEFSKMRGKASYAALGKVDTLVIDEVSMLSGEYLDWYMSVLQTIPVFSGKRRQIVLCGDFAQIPPVACGMGRVYDCDHAARWSDRENKGAPFGITECTGMYAFQTAFWKRERPEVHQLTGVHRTRDSVLLAALVDMRNGNGHTEPVRKLLLATHRVVNIGSGVKATKLFPRKDDVYRENATNLSRLPAKSEHEYHSYDSVTATAPGSEDALRRDQFYTDCQAPGRLVLRMGAQVMLLRNEPHEECADLKDKSLRLVNGSTGVVVAFVDATLPSEQSPIVLFTNGRRKTITSIQFSKTIYARGECYRQQLPLQLAWAITIHKSQGASLQHVVVNLQGVFNAGQAYVAVSRATQLEGLQIRNFNASDVKASPLVLEFDKAIREGNVDEFIDNVPTWWRPVMNTSWEACYHRNKVWSAMQAEFPQACDEEDTDEYEDQPDTDEY